MHGVKSTRIIDGKQINILVNFNSEPLSRSLLEMKEMSQTSADNYGRCNVPLLGIELDHIIVDELHLLLRITDVLTAN